MFNLLMSGGAWAPNHGAIGVTRVLEHSSDAMRARFYPGNALDVQAVTTIPTLFASETQSEDTQDAARVGRLMRVVRQGRDYNLDYILDLNIPPIPNSVLKGLARELGLMILSSVAHIGPSKKPTCLKFCIEQICQCGHKPKFLGFRKAMWMAILWPS